MFSNSVLRPVLLSAVVASIAGCVVTGGSVRATDSTVSGQRIESRPSRNSGDVLIYDEASKPARPYTVVANVKVWGRILTAVSSRPTRGDVDEELRAKATKLGADAVINVHYHTSRAGVWPRGQMTATGQAVIFNAS
jgi:Putative heavy-metal-binding